MFKLMINKPGMAKGTYCFYTEVVTDVDEDTGETTQRTVVFETDDLQDLSEKYLKLLKKYTGDQIKAVEDMTIDLIANIENR